MGNQNQNQQKDAIKTFVLGSKGLDGKTAEFQYDHGWYTIFDIVGEERTIVFKSKNAQESYNKWGVYIGRKKERPVRESVPDVERESEKKHDNQDNRKKNQKHQEFDSEELQVARDEEREREKRHNHNKNRNRSRNHSHRNKNNVEHNDHN